MGKKAEFGTPKWISNNIKSKGLQKLRWYCQMCEKQCRDENGFKCHTMSEAHQRQLLLFGENPANYLSTYSKEPLLKYRIIRLTGAWKAIKRRDFEKAYTDILKRQYNEKRVHANVVYQQYIGDKEHIHMNSTCWVTLTSFVKHLGRTGKCEIDETEKGWYVTWVEKDFEQQEWERKMAKKDKATKDEEERKREYIDAQIAKAKEQSTLDEGQFEATELLKAEDEELKLDMNFKKNKIQEANNSGELKNVFKKVAPASAPKKDQASDKGEKRKKEMSALEEIMEWEKKRKKEEEDKKPKARCWLTENIVVKVITKSLGDKYYKKKGHISKVIDDFAAVVVMNDSGGKVKLDQDHLETVVPQVGREVVVLWGQYAGQTAVLRSIDTEKFSASIKLQDGEKVRLPYEQFSKKYQA